MGEQDDLAVGKVKTWRASRGWILAALLPFLLGILAATAVAHAADRVNNERFGRTLNALMTDLEEQINGYQMLSLAVGFMLQPDGLALPLDTVYQYAEGEDRVAGQQLLSVVQHFPMEGFAAYALVSSNPNEQPMMLPNTRGLGVSVAGAPEVRATVASAISLGSSLLGGPVEVDGESLYYYATPIFDDIAGVEFLSPQSLLAGSDSAVHQDVLEVLIFDDELTIATTGETVIEPRARRTLDYLGRELVVTATVGSAFNGEDGRLVGLALVALGTTLGILVYIAGVASRRRVLFDRERLRVAQAVSEDKDRFIAAISHELRTPLTSVTGIADLMALTLHSASEQELKELSSIMLQESTLMAMLVEDLIVARRAADGTVKIAPDRLHLDVEVQNVCIDLGDRAEGVIVRKGGAVAWADSLRVRQIIKNLILNAVRHGGPIVRVMTGTGATEAWIEVLDDGPGIHGEARARMFEPYYRSTSIPGHAPSVGLGLSVAHSLAVAMGGTLSYDYSMNSSTFRLVLPAHRGSTVARAEHDRDDHSRRWRLTRRHRTDSIGVG